MMPRAMELETTMIQVPAGPENNDIYYIPVGNLRFDTTWQQLKDFVRTVTEVLHVEVFPRSTAGWVKVQGLDNFERAFQHLNGGALDGMSLIADGRNRTQPVMIRIVATSRAAVSDKYSPFTHPSTTSGTDLDGKHTHYHSTHNEPAIVGYAAYEHHTLTMPMAGGYGYLMRSPTAYCGSTYGQQYLVSTRVDESYNNFTQDPSQAEHYPGSGISVPVERPPPGLLTQDKASNVESGVPEAYSYLYKPDLRVLIKNLPRRETNETFLRELIETHLAADIAADVLEVDVGFDYKNRSKGYAFVQFGMFESVVQAVAVFDGLKVLGHSLEARASSEDKNYLDGKQPTRDKDGSKKHVGSKVKARPRSQPLRHAGQLAGEPSSTASTCTNLLSHPQVKGGMDRETGKKDAPVVVDGSISLGKKAADNKRR